MDNQTLAELIAERRREMNLSLQGLANSTGISKQHIHMMEKGTSTNPSVSTLVALGASLGISAHILFRAAVSGLEE